jgi:hypothetical protein
VHLAVADDAEPAPNMSIQRIASHVRELYGHEGDGGDHDNPDGVREVQVCDEAERLRTRNAVDRRPACM